MIVFLSIAAGLAAIVTVALGVKTYAMKKSARELADCFSFALKNDTNQGVTLSSRDKDMLKLAKAIDGGLKKLRTAFLTYDNGNAELKKAVTDVSHDLRTPLTAVSGYMELLEKEKKSKTVAEYLSIIKNRVSAMKKLTEELFDYSYATSKDDVLTAVDIKSEIEASLLDFYTEFGKKGIEPKITMPENKVMRNLDRDKLKRILSNIISNAAKYSQTDFSVEMTESGEATFCNTAPDLDALGVARLFDRYYTVGGSVRAGGLGLSIARELTEDLGGSLDGLYKNGKLYIVLKL